MSPTDLLNEAGAGDYIGDVPPGTLKQWRHLGKGPRYVKFGRHVRYRRSDLDAWIEAHTVEPSKPEDRYSARLRRAAR
jgi:hypothetical protein